MKLKSLSIKKKFIVIMLVFMLLPTFVVSFWMYYKISNSWIQKEYSIQANEIGNILSTTEKWLDEYKDIMYSVYMIPELMEILEKPANEWSSGSYLKLTDILNNILSKDTYVKGAYLFMDNGKVVSREVQLQGQYETLYRQNSQWADAIKKRDGKITWIPTHKIQKTYNTYYNFSCGILMKNLYDIKKSYGTLVLNIDIRLFDDLFALLGQVDDNTTYLLTDEEGNIIWSNKMEAADKLDQEFFRAVCTQEYSCDVQKYEGIEYVTTSFHSGYNGWNYISMKSKAEVMKSRRWVLTAIIIQIFLILVLAVAGAGILEHYIIRPIRKMVVVMSRPEKELQGMRMQIDQEDEIGRLYQSFNEMRERIEEYIQLNEETNKREREYQIQALNAQINPHFMYNTLDTLHWMAMEIPEPKMCQLITSFSDILRYSISKKSTFVTLEEELKCIQNYIMIYEERYEKKFGHFEIDERIYPYRTSKMLLQPIVENSIVHGFSNNLENAVLEVIGEIQGEEAVIRIRDNGCGISQERVLYLLSRDSNRIGLSNIHQRLKLLYGEEYGLVILSEKSRGTEVILRFPKESFEK
ncbi:sensor histidine kinase [Ruminococcus sp. 2227st1_E6_2227SCRN_220401]|uniref:sensor histidine kinase n=1 Tax=unclassified Ruminococcus TaxID=2608920 RepID=UPI00319DADA8